jgi:hypothetical protein
MKRLRESAIIISASALGPASVTILTYIIDAIYPGHGAYRRFAIYFSYLQLATSFSLLLLIIGIQLKTTHIINSSEKRLDSIKPSHNSSEKKIALNIMNLTCYLAINYQE